MLNLTLRDEFKRQRLKGTTIDFSADTATSALRKPTAEFLNFTYTASGMFSDVADKEQTVWLKTNFGSSRFANGVGTARHWTPPASLCLITEHGEKQFAIGRQKWRSAGGYPTLADDVLSLLEVAVPFVEISTTKV